MSDEREELRISVWLGAGPGVIDGEVAGRTVEGVTISAPRELGMGREMMHNALEVLRKAFNFAPGYGQEHPWIVWQEGGGE